MISGPPPGRPRYGRWYPEREYDTDPPPEYEPLPPGWCPLWVAVIVWLILIPLMAAYLLEGGF